MTRAPTEEGFPLAPVQRGMLYHHVREDRPGVDVEQILGRLREPIDPDRFERAWRLLAERHQALRTSFRWEGRDEPVQVAGPDAEVAFEYRDWSDAPDGEREARLERFLEEDRAAEFDLSRPPLFRIALIRYGPEDHRLVWTFHHSILDGRSFPLALRELFEIYRALGEDRRPELEDPVDFSDHVEWLERDYPAGSDDREFWSELLSGFEAPTPLPFRGDRADRADREDGGDGPGAGGTRGETETRLSGEMVDRLRRTAERCDVTLNTVFQAAWGLLLGRFADEEDVVFGTARAGRAASVDGEGGARALGMFMNTVPVRVRLDPDEPLEACLRRLRSRDLSVRSHEQAFLGDVQQWSDLPAGEPLFRSLLIYDHFSLDGWLSEEGEWERRDFRLRENPGYPLALYAYGEEGLLRLSFDPERFGEAEAGRLLDYLQVVLESMVGEPDRAVGDVSLLPEEERDRLLREWNETDAPLPDARLEELFGEQAESSPDRAAVLCEGEEVTYRELDRRAERIAGALRARGVEPGSVVGVCMSRSPTLLACLLAIHRAGAAYLPLDPTYPEERLRFMVEDSGTGLVLTEEGLEATVPGEVERLTGLGEIARGRGDGTADGGPRDEGRERERDRERDEDLPGSGLAYLIYTSGSTGRPKGVMVEHRNVVNFFRGMEERVGADGVSTWLATTTLSFDISVLELYWTLVRGDRVVLLPGDPIEALPGAEDAGDDEQRVGSMDFGLFFFGGDASLDDERYGLLTEAARFADERGFEAVWTPERHFHDFGGPYPNPSVTGAAVAAVTERVEIRAGSVVLPLHDPIRVAENWSVVDALSGGRAAISFASGWQPEDFVLAPDRYEDRREEMFEAIETVRALWRGDSVTREGHDGDEVELETHPSPVQSELPAWITAAGSPETFRRAGEMDADVITHMLGQDLDELRQKIAEYRDARREAGHDPDGGQVAVMLHTFVGPDHESVREAVEGPLKGYLSDSMSLLKEYADEWTAYRGDGTDGEEAEGDEFAELSEEDREALLEHAFQRYYATNGLFGPPDSCDDLLEELSAAGVDEIAALVDFGPEPGEVLDGLEHLDRLRRRWSGGSPARDGRDSGDGREGEATSGASLPELIERHGVTDFQCTPSLLRLLFEDRRTRSALSSLDRLLVGGETFPPELAARAADELGGTDVHNMYGPTETTIWSSTHRVEEPDREERVPIGRPIANTRFYVLDGEGRPVPTGVAGELYIGGEGVARGYHGRPELTGEVFRPDPFAADDDARMYRTGDRVRYREDGVLDFLGRVDRQVKIRGHRVELGEIEATLGAHPRVDAAAARVARGDGGDPIAYVVESPDAAGDGGAPLREFAADRLPGFMVPGRVVRLEEFPLTPNGKIDRSALPDPASAANGDGPSEPQNRVEERLVTIWRDVLEVEDVGVRDDFFDLGGNSLATVQVASRIREAFGVELPLRTFFESTRVVDLAGAVEEEILGGADAGEVEELLEAVEDLSDREVRDLLSEESGAAG